MLGDGTQIHLQIRLVGEFLAEVNHFFPRTLLVVDGELYPDVVGRAVVEGDVVAYVTHSLCDADLRTWFLDGTYAPVFPDQLAETDVIVCFACPSQGADASSVEQIFHQVPLAVPSRQAKQIDVFGLGVRIVQHGCFYQGVEFFPMLVRDLFEQGLVQPEGFHGFSTPLREELGHEQEQIGGELCFQRFVKLLRDAYLLVVFDFYQAEILFRQDVYPLAGKVVGDVPLQHTVYFASSAEVGVVHAGVGDGIVYMYHAVCVDGELEDDDVRRARAHIQHEDIGYLPRLQKAVFGQLFSAVDDEVVSGCFGFGDAFHFYRDVAPRFVALLGGFLHDFFHKLGHAGSPFGGIADVQEHSVEV